MHKLDFITKTGAAIAEHFDDLAKLRIAVFRDYPYLYEGSVEYERQYLSTYSNSSSALLFAVYDDREMVGATTCIPLIDETPEVQEPFLKNGMDLGEIFYFGESILLKTYRGLGLGHRFFDVREAHAAHFNTYKITCFCAVNRADDHSARPSDYRPNDAFWKKRGYTPDPKLESLFEWTDIGNPTPTRKRMTYWCRNLGVR